MARTKQTARKSTGGMAPSRMPKPPPPKCIADVWKIAELAEIILALLPMRDLLLAQRVCKDWSDFIKSSSKLQELLFLLPKRSRAGRQDEPESPPDREMNPLLLEQMPFFFIESPDGYDQNVSNAPWADRLSRLAFLRPEASWRGMLPTQPPYKVFEHAKIHSSRGGTSLKVGNIEEEDGIRMGLLYDRSSENFRGLSHGLPKIYILMDGKAAPNLREDWSDIDYDFDEENSGPAPQPNMVVVPRPELDLSKVRVFGGVNKLTLVSQTNQGCEGMVSGDTWYRIRITTRRFVSSGYEESEIEYTMPTELQQHPRRYWIKEGFTSGQQ